MEESSPNQGNQQQPTLPLFPSHEGKGQPQMFIQDNRQAIFIGNITHPQLIKGWMEILPSAPERILSITEKEQNFAHTYHLREQAIKVATTLVGQIFGFLISLLGIGGGIYLVAAGKPISGLCAVFLAVATVIGTAVWGRNVPPPQKQETQ